MKLSIRELELACKQGLACRQVLAYTLALEHKLALGHKLEQLYEQELGHRKRSLHIQLRLHFLNRHLLCYKLQFECVHQVTKLCIDQKLSIHHGARFVQSLLRYNHLEQRIRIDKQLVRLHKLVPCHRLELEHKLVSCHRLELEHDKEQEARRQMQQPKVQSVQ